MRLLLDTHTFVWWTISAARLSSRTRSILKDRRNLLFLSVVSLWEMQLKMQLSKLHFNSPLSRIVEEQQRVNGLHLLPIAPDHIYGLEQRPFHHKDPFDRCW